MCDNPAILNLHLLLWDSYYEQLDVRPSVPRRTRAVEDKELTADTHLALARSQNRRKRHFGSLQKNNKVQKNL